ncbi:MAG: response regulator [Anaerolineae bacterium]|nr:response regulator [Anaerolineae bacterium]
MDKIKVLIVDDNDDTRDGTRRLLEYEDDIEIVDFAENGLIALEKVKEHKPEVVLMDINMPVMDGLTATQRLTAEFPRTQVIIVSVQDDASYMRKAIRAGAVDFVAKPISSDEMAEAIRRAYSKIPAAPVAPSPGAVPSHTPAMPGYEYGMPSTNGKVIAIIGPKGGVGKTTLAINVGIGLIKVDPSRRVVIIDGNVYFGDIGVFLNTRGQYSLIDMAVLAQDPDEIDNQSVDAIVVPHESGVKLLVSPPNPSEITPISVQMMANVIDHLKTQYDYVIIDTATTFDDILVSTIQNSDRLVLLTTATMPSLKDVRVMFGELMGAEYKMENVLLVLNQVQKNQRITGEQIANFLNHQIAVEIPMDQNADEAVNRGVPLITLDAKRSPAVGALVELVQKIQESFEVSETEDYESGYDQRGRSGLFRRP